MYGDELVHRHDHDVSQFCSGIWSVTAAGTASAADVIKSLMSSFARVDLEVNHMMLRCLMVSVGKKL